MSFELYMCDAIVYLLVNHGLKALVEGVRTIMKYEE